MISQQLLNYIKQQTQIGKTKQEIISTLQGNGWQIEDIEQGFSSLDSGIPVAPASTEIPSSRQIYKESWAIYKNRFKTLIAISVIPVASYVVLGLFSAIIAPTANYLHTTFQGWGTLVIIILAIIAFIFIIYLAVWASAAQLCAIRDQTEGVGWKEAFKRGRGKINPFFSTGILVGLVILGGYILLIIPGIIFSLWFSQTPYIVIEESLQNSAALKRSKYYVKGRIGQIFGKLFYIGIISFALYIALAIVLVIFDSILHINPNYTSWLLNIFSLIWGPLVTVYGYQVYKHAKASRP